MSHYDEEKAQIEQEPTTPTISNAGTEILQEPSKGLKNPLLQVVFLAFICFCCPGMFNALGGLGGGGQEDASTSDNATVALYSTFATFGFFGGSICNKLGPRITLMIGAIPYAIYIGSFLSYSHNQQSGFPIAAGAILGVGAGLLWTAQGSLMLGYATEANKGKYIAVFWAIFNLGAVIGDAVATGQNANSDAGAVTDGTYIAFLCITSIGAFLPLLMANPKDIVRSDGTQVTVSRNPSWLHEIKGLFICLYTDPLVLLLFPFFLGSNWFYTYQQSDYNLALFDTRTRSLNAMLYYGAQIFGAGFFGYFLDYKGLARKSRAWLGWVILFVVILVTWGGDWAIQKTYTRADVTAPSWVKGDWSSSNYAGRCILYIIFGLTDSMWQSYAYWVMGAMSNDVNKLAYLTGFYKGIQSAGAAIVWRLDALKVSYVRMYASSFGLLGAGLLIMLPMIYLRVHEHTTADEEDIAHYDETGRISDLKKNHASEKV